jgi:hypothetical protein
MIMIGKIAVKGPDCSIVHCFGYLNGIIDYKRRLGRRGGGLLTELVDRTGLISARRGDNWDISIKGGDKRERRTFCGTMKPRYEEGGEALTGRVSVNSRGKRVECESGRRVA